MKQAFLLPLIALVAILLLASSCQKETNASILGLSESGESFVPPARECLACPNPTTTIDLVDDMENRSLREGDNIIKILADAALAIAHVKNGTITHWILQRKSGQRFLAKSSEAIQTSRVPGGVTFVRNCFYLDGRWTCFITIKK